MRTYALLVEPSFNRVYTRQAPDVLVAELAFVDREQLGVVTATRRVTRGGAPFVELDVEGELTRDDLATLIELSSAYVLFEVRGGALVPCDVSPVACYDDDLLSTLRYAGKTNEHFTKLLVNVATAASPAVGERRLTGERIRLLDPLAGRGTTLNQGLMLGYDVAGIEADRRDTDAYGQFLETWLKDKRIKHRVQSWTYRKGRETPAHERLVHIKRTALGEPHDQVVKIVHDDTLNAREHQKRSSVDVIATDLPYGVQHGSRTTEWGSSRSAAGLLEAALPVWRSVLRGGGAMALAFNARTIRRTEVVALLEGADLDVVDPERSGFEHHVDRSITRDVVVARKPTS